MQIIVILSDNFICCQFYGGKFFIINLLPFIITLFPSWEQETNEEFSLLLVELTILHIVCSQSFNGPRELSASYN